MKSLLIFDLDGTLIDSRLDLAHSVNAMLAFMTKPPIPHETIQKYVGNGAATLVRRALGQGASEEEVEKGHTFFLAYYNDHKLDYTELYPGVEGALAQFAGLGCRMAVLTNKPVRISNAILEGLSIKSRFFQVYGGNSFEFKKPNPIGIEKLRAEAGSGHIDTVMVGDSGVDIQTARNAGVRSCGVTYGFQPETFAEFPPDLLVDRLEQLADHLNGTAV